MAASLAIARRRAAEACLPCAGIHCAPLAIERRVSAPAAHPVAGARLGVHHAPMARMRVLYAAGPGDVIGTHSHWARGDDDPGVPDVAYSWQFYETCHRLGAEGWIIAGRQDRARQHVGDLRLEHRPVPFASASGVLFHLGRILYTLGILLSAVRFRASLLVASGHGTHWFVYRLGRWLGVRVVPSLHNTLWPEAGTSRVNRQLLAMARPLFRRGCFAILSHPGACARQVAELTNGAHAPILPFQPWYRASAFSDVAPPPASRAPFRVLFVGRIERDKGIFDLLAVAHKLANEGRTDIEFDLCGAGSQLDLLRAMTAEAGLADRFRCHGRRDGEALRTMFSASHVVVVPTRPEFAEGFNAVVSEAVLAGRPVVTSRICPALDVVREAAIEVPPADVQGYARAIVLLSDDPAAYESRRQACRALRATLTDRDHSWGAALVRVTERLPVGPVGAASPSAVDRE